MHLTEATLIYKNIKMRLVFNLEITSAELNRRPVVDSLSYQEGTFRLDLTGWSQDADKVIPSEMWKKVRDKPED